MTQPMPNRTKLVRPPMISLPPTKFSMASGSTSAKRGTAKASYHQSPVMNIVPTTAAPKARAPNARALH